MEDDTLERLPHGPAFRFLDRVLFIRDGERVVALKNVTANDPALHRPERQAPTLPGTLLMESMTQAAGLLLPKGSTAMLAQVRRTRLLRGVAAGEAVRVEAACVANMGALFRFDVAATVDGEPVADAEIILAVNPSPPGETR